MQTHEMTFIFVFSYSIDKLTILRVYKIDLMLNLCVDDSCVEIPVLKGIHLPIPACEGGPESYRLPGNDTVAGFLEILQGEIGDSAIELVLQKLNIYVRISCLHF